MGNDRRRMVLPPLTERRPSMPHRPGLTLLVRTGRPPNDRPKLPEDPRRRTPDAVAGDQIGAEAELEVAERRLEDLDRAPGRNADTGARTIDATSSGDGVSSGRRAAIASTGVTR
jgi:hypothetical protein